MNALDGGPQRLDRANCPQDAPWRGVGAALAMLLVLALAGCATSGEKPTQGGPPPSTTPGSAPPSRY